MYFKNCPSYIEGGEDARQLLDLLDATRQRRKDLFEKRQHGLERLREALMEVEILKSQLSEVNAHIGVIRCRIKHCGQTIPLQPAVHPDHKVIVEGVRHTASLKHAIWCHPE